MNKVNFLKGAKLPDYKSTSKIILSLLGFIIIIGALSYWIYKKFPPKVISSSLDSFAQCLASKNITMYGAAWCAHCQNEKRAFGSSFKYVPYVECPDQPKKCADLGITGLPTWIFPDGRRLEGEQGLQKLSEASDCELK